MADETKSELSDAESRVNDTGDEMKGTQQKWLRDSLWRNPVVVIALLILLGVFILIGAAIFGLDEGFLVNMSKTEFARGLITYLFAVATIGIAVVLVVSALTGQLTDENEKKFQHGKEVLSLLLGVFGTVVGFYFGSAITESKRIEEDMIRLTPPLLSQSNVTAGESVTLTAAVIGGNPPYRYGITLEDDIALKYEKFVSPNAWIVTEIQAPEVNEPTVAIIRIGVIDATGKSAITSAELSIAPIVKPTQ